MAAPEPSTAKKEGPIESFLFPCTILAWLLNLCLLVEFSVSCTSWRDRLREATGVERRSVEAQRPFACPFLNEDAP